MGSLGWRDLEQMGSRNGVRIPRFRGTGDHGNYLKHHLIASAHCQFSKPGTYDALSHLLFTPLPTMGSSGGPIIDDESGAVVGVMLGTRMDNRVEGVRGWGVPSETIFEVQITFSTFSDTHQLLADVQSSWIGREMLNRSNLDLFCLFVSNQCGKNASYGDRGPGPAQPIAKCRELGLRHFPRSGCSANCGLYKPLKCPQFPFFPHPHVSFSSQPLLPLRYFLPSFDTHWSLVMVLIDVSPMGF